MGKEHWLSAGNTPQPLRCIPLMPLQSFVFPCRPSRQYTVKVLESGVQRRFVETTIVVDPATKHRIEHPGDSFQRLVTAQVQCPLSHDMAHLLGRLVAHRRAEIDNVLAPAVLRPPGSEGIAEEVELLLGITSPSVVILTLDDLRLFGMKCTFAPGESPAKSRHKPLSLSFTFAVANDVVSISLERDMRAVLLHPEIEGMVEKEIRKDWADDPALRNPPLRVDEGTIFKLHRGFQPPFDVEEHPWRIDVHPHRPQE